MRREHVRLEDNPLWYKDAVIYEIHVKAFFDSDNDGIGDFKGLTQKLDYLSSLGITALWLLPFYPSPLRDDGYDIADYFKIHPDYGTLRDFKEFLREAHHRGIRVITELVLNHTSDQHMWFQKARRAKPGSVMRNYYVWSDTPDEKYQDARIIFQDFENSNWTWDSVAEAYFWHRFYSHQPDLNYDNPHVLKAVFNVIDYWMKMGVDGVRLDAVPYLIEREGTNCENLPETHEILRKLRAHVDAKFKDRMLLAEANQWPEDAVAYFGDGDMCHMAFHFPLMPRMFMALQMEDSFPIIDIMDQTPAIPENCQWALFLRNHDELTLEMVTDEERDYMYRMYAKDPRMRVNLGIRRRLAPLLDHDLRRMKLMYALLFSLPGTPVIYYGNEIGMGDNFYIGDRNGVRTPMQWSPDRNAGFSRANPQQLYLPPITDPSYHFEAVNVETMEKTHFSFLWWMRLLIAMRKHHKVLSRGSLEVVPHENRKVFAFMREYEGERALVAVNLSRFPTAVRLDLSRFSGHVPVEMFSKGRFPSIESSSYTLTFAPYSWYMFLLEPEEAEPAHVSGFALQIEVEHAWEDVLEGRTKERLEEEILPAYLKRCRWFGKEDRQMEKLEIIESIPVGNGNSSTRLLLLRIEYTEGLPQMYTLPLAFTADEEAEEIREESPQAVVSKLKVNGRSGVLYESVYNEEFLSALLSLIARKRRIKTASGELVAYLGKNFKNNLRGREGELKPRILKTEHTNTPVAYGNEFFLKLYRRPDEGVNPDLDIIRFLNEKAQFSHVPQLLGGIEFRRPGAEPIALAMLEYFVPNQGDSWSYYLDALNNYYERVLAGGVDIKEIPQAHVPLLELSKEEAEGQAVDLITGVPLEMAALLGKRTAQLHIALFSEKEDSQFAPEPSSILWQRSVFQTMQSLTKQVFGALRKKLKDLDENTSREAAEFVALQHEVISLERLFTGKKYSAPKTRYHGNYHLGEVLFTGKDYVITDFEGDPSKMLSERRLKRSPLRDVASMIRSFHYAAYISLLKEAPLRPEDRPGLEPWAELWYRYVGAAFLKEYVETASGAGFMPADREELENMLLVFMLYRAVHELGAEIANRPEWVIIPIRGIMNLLEWKGEGTTRQVAARR
jgi:maltose alpha-D-glucosyltransferase/alpha-amylase